MGLGQRIIDNRNREDGEREAFQAEERAKRHAVELAFREDQKKQPGFAPVLPTRPERQPVVYRLGDALGERGLEASLPLPIPDPGAVQALVAPITAQLVEDLRDHPDTRRAAETNALCGKARDGLRALEVRLLAAKAERDAAFQRVDPDLGDRLETLDREIWLLEGDLPSARQRLVTFQRMASSAGANFARETEMQATTTGIAGRMGMIAEANELLRQLLEMPAVRDLLARVALLHTGARQLELHRHMNGIEQALQPIPAGEPAPT